MKKIIFFYIITNYISINSICYASSTCSKPIKAKVQIEFIEIAIQLFKLDTKSYPYSKEDLLILQKGVSYEEEWNGPYLKIIPKDPWGNEYVYLFPSKYGLNEYDLYSLGADGKDQFGRNDDISNWNGINEGYYGKLKQNDNLLIYCIIILSISFFAVGIAKIGKPSVGIIASRFIKLFFLLLICNMLLFVTMPSYIFSNTIFSRIFSMFSFFTCIFCLFAGLFAGIVDIYKRKRRKPDNTT